MTTNRTQKLNNHKRRIQYLLRDRHWTDQPHPMFTAGNIHYELADRARGLGSGGIGASICWPGTVPCCLLRHANSTRPRA